MIEGLTVTSGGRDIQFPFRVVPIEKGGLAKDPNDSPLAIQSGSGVTFVREPAEPDADSPVVQKDSLCMVAQSSQHLLAEIVDVHRPEEVHPIQRRLESAGLTASSLHRSEKRSEAALSGKGTEVRLTLLCPDNGFAIITLSYSFKGTGPETKADAESLLASVHGLLDPAGTSPVSK